MKYKERTLKKEEKRKAEENAPEQVKQINNQIMRHRLNRILYKRFLQEKATKNKNILDTLEKA